MIGRISKNKEFLTSKEEFMRYKAVGQKIFARIDRGEEVVSSLCRICAEAGASLAEVRAIGAVGSFTVGVFSPRTKTYKANSFKGDFEIVSLSGTVTQKDGEPYLHLHAAFAGADGAVFGGHLNEAVVSATCEAVLDLSPGSIGRAFSDEVGLNLFDI